MNVRGNRLLAIASLLAVLTAVAFAQGPRGTSSATFGGKKVEIEYGRPSLAGRDMLGKVRPGMVWRLGMNQATSLTTEADLAFGEVTVPKGSYSLFAKKVSDTTWHLIVNKQTGQWGTQHDASQDLVEIPLKVMPAESGTETFTIDLSADGNKGSFKAMWATTILSAHFTAK